MTGGLSDSEQRRGSGMRELTGRMMRMQALLHRRLMEGLAETGLSVGQPKVLAYLKSHEGRCQKEIAAACQLEPGSLTVLLNRMEKQGMIERRMEGNNRRSRYIYLREHGKRLAALVVERFYEVEELAFAGISEEDRAAFVRVSDGIIGNLMRNS